MWQELYFVGAAATYLLAFLLVSEDVNLNSVADYVFLHGISLGFAVIWPVSLVILLPGVLFYFVKEVLAN